jgi:hypothetical protein
MKAGREAVLAYRIAAQGLRREVDSPQALAVLGLGVQNTPPGSARLACAVRLSSVPSDFAGLRVAWTYRLSPHLHHDADLAGVAGALWPASEADAVSRLNWPGARLAGTGKSATEIIEQATDAMLDVLTEPMTKGAASAAVTERVDEPLTMWCKACQSTHVYDSLFRLAAGLAGAWLDTDANPTLITPTPGWTRPVHDPAKRTELIKAYLRFLGPARPADVADFLSVNKAELVKNWPGDLVEVEMDGATGFLPPEDIDALRTPPEPPRVRLLPPGDPYLQARDRKLIVPDAKAQKVLWRILGNPGAVLVDGEIVGAWRAKALGKRRLEFQLEPFDELPPDLAPLLDEEARLVAAARGISDATVVGTR